MSRKTIFTIIAVVGSVLAVFSSAFGLTINPTVVLAAVASVLVYVFGEAKADLARLGEQKDKWKDPKMWIAAVAAALAALTEAGVNIPVSPELIIAVLTAIMGVLFKTDARLAKPTA